MAEIKLFRLNSTVEELKPSEVALERNLQTCIEKNMQAFFGVRFLRSEYPIMMMFAISSNRLAI